MDLSKYEAFLSVADSGSFNGGQSVYQTYQAMSGSAEKEVSCTGIPVLTGAQ